MADILNNTTYITYLDESEDHGKSCYIFSSVSIPVEKWNEIFYTIRNFRKDLFIKYGLDCRKELHARDFISGRGRFSRIITKFQRNEIFKQYLEMVATLSKHGVFSTNVCLDSYDSAFDRIINRINTTLKVHKDFGILIFDAGNENQVIKTLRKKRVINFIPSAYGSWQDGKSQRNIPIEQIVAEASFRDSKIDYLIQTVDFIAFALLRSEHPTSLILKYGTNNAFGCLKPILNLDATRYDEYGIVRK